MRGWISRGRLRSVGVIEPTEQAESGESLLSLWLLSGVVPELRGELEHGVAGPVRQKRENVAEIGPGLDPVKLAAGNERSCSGVPFGAVVATAEGPVGSTDDLPAEFDLAHVVVEAK